MGKEEEHEIIIVGGGIAGLATALALHRFRSLLSLCCMTLFSPFQLHRRRRSIHRKGTRSLVLEKSETLRAMGAAIGIFLNGWRALDQLGVGNELRAKTIPLVNILDASLNNIEKRRVTDCRNEALRCLKRSDLIETLANHLPRGTIRFHCQVVAIEEDPITSFPNIHVNDGSIIKAKVLIGCDGSNSVIARSLGLQAPRLFPLLSVRGFTDYSDEHNFLPCFLRLRGDRCIFGRLPIDEKLVYWFIGLICPPQDFEFQNDPLHIRDLTLDLIKGFPDDTMQMVKQCDLHSLSLTHIRYRAPWHLLFENFVRGTITVAGDSMHAMGPFLGQGGSAGMEDSIVLARHLSKVINNEFRGEFIEVDQQRRRIGKALEDYVKERRPRLLRLSMQSFLMGSMIASSSMAKRLLCITILWVFFGGFSVKHAHYDCGLL